MVSIQWTLRQRLSMQSEQQKLLEHRIDVVIRVLEYPNLSDWAKTYWKQVLRQLMDKLPYEAIN